MKLKNVVIYEIDISFDSRQGRSEQTAGRARSAAESLKELGRMETLVGALLTQVSGQSGVLTQVWGWGLEQPLPARPLPSRSLQPGALGPGLR